METLYIDDRLAGKEDGIENTITVFTLLYFDASFKVSDELGSLVVLGGKAL